MQTTGRVWLITGCSRGLGRAVAEYALQQGDKVALTARNPDSLRDLQAQFPEQSLALRLDVTDKQSIEQAVEACVQHFGKIDIVLNNAGQGLVGALEELTDEQIMRNLAVNFWGPVNVLRAVLPYMRAQKSGHILTMSAIAGFTGEPGFSIYGGAKFAMEGVSESLQLELAHLGIRVTMIEPGPFRTGFIEHSLEQGENELADYAQSVGKFKTTLQKINGTQPGNPVKAAEVIFSVTRSETPPLRLILGQYACRMVRKKLKQVQAELDVWEPVSVATDFEKVKVRL